MKIKIDCPTSFINLSNYSLTLSDDPEFIIVDPGTKHFLGKDYFKHYHNLKMVGTPSTGVNHIDKVYLEKRGIKVFCLLDDRETLDAITASSEFTWLHIMNGFRNFTKAIKNTDKWRNLENENLLRTNELSEKNILIIGLGRIGKKIKKYAQAFEMNVSYYDPYVYDSSINRIDELKNLQKYDCISVNCYLNDETKNIIDREFLSQIKNNCILVNTSRGEVVNESDIVDFIISNGNFYFGADVLCNEQNIDKLLKSKIYSLSKKIENVVITPHVAGATIESQTKAFNAIIKLFQENNV